MNSLSRGDKAGYPGKSNFWVFAEKILKTKIHREAPENCSFPIEYSVKY
jgi:hypothetical protein